jgi:5-(carboxyamino)imidazole ribonucleotide mutase
MPPGIPVATVAVNGAQNAGILAVQMMSLGDRELAVKLESFKESLKKKIVKANKDLSEIKFRFKTN